MQPSQKNPKLWTSNRFKMTECSLLNCVWSGIALVWLKISGRVPMFVCDMHMMIIGSSGSGRRNRTYIIHGALQLRCYGYTMLILFLYFTFGPIMHPKKEHQYGLFCVAYLALGPIHCLNKLTDLIGASECGPQHSQAIRIEPWRSASVNQDLLRFARRINTCPTVLPANYVLKHPSELCRHTTSGLLRTKILQCLTTTIQ